MYYFNYSSNFKKSSRKLPKNIADKFYERLELLQQDKFNPILNNHKLSGEYEGRSSINITGDYRLIFEFLNENIIKLVDIGTHSELYE